MRCSVYRILWSKFFIRMYTWNTFHYLNIFISEKNLDVFFCICKYFKVTLIKFTLITKLSFSTKKNLFFCWHFVDFLNCIFIFVLLIFFPIDLIDTIFNNLKILLYISWCCNLIILNEYKNSTKLTYRM